MQKEIVLTMDYRCDEGARPRKNLVSPCITTTSRGGGIPTSTPLVVERWIKSESNKPQDKVT